MFVWVAKWFWGRCAKEKRWDSHLGFFAPPWCAVMLHSRQQTSESDVSRCRLSKHNTGLQSRDVLETWTYDQGLADLLRVFLERLEGAIPKVISIHIQISELGEVSRDNSEGTTCKEI